MNTAGTAIVEVVTNSPAETLELGCIIGTRVRPPVVFALFGELGSGKTVFSKGLASGLGVDASRVVSPTFVLMNRYEGRIPVVHIDAFRLGGDEEFFQLGCDEVFYSDAIVLLEWADRVRGALPEDYLSVTIEHRGELCRRLTFQAFGDRAQRVVEHIRAVVEAG